MAFDGSWRPLEEVVVDIIDRRGVTPTKLGGEFTSSGHRVISAKLMKGGRLDLAADEPRFVERGIYEKWMRSPLQRGDVLMTSEAPLGELAYMLESADWCLGQRLFALRPKTTLIDGRFLYYALQTAEVRSDINSRATGTTVLGIRQAELRKVRVPVLSLDEQKLASTLLGALDDRIDLLRQTNATLEAIAQALFKSWFVDFDPVRAKAEGREPEGMDAATAALFPCEFEESELGLVPRGWRTQAVYEAAQYINGAAYKAFNPNTERRGLPIIKIAELKLGVTSQTAFSDEEMAPKYRIDSGDILFSWSGNPDTSIDTFVWSRGQALLNQHIFRVVPKITCDRSRILAMLKFLRPRFAEIARNKQTTGLGHVTVADLKEMRVVLPPSEVVACWNRIVDPIVEKALSTQLQAQLLEDLRDTLLPRLISGKLRLGEAQVVIEDSTA